MTVAEVNEKEKVLDKYLAELNKYRKEDQQELGFLLAAEFAARVLPVFEKEFPADDRPRKAIQAARDFANGKISLTELRDAAQAAADTVHEACVAAPDDDTADTPAVRAANCAALAAGYGEIGPDLTYINSLAVVGRTAKTAAEDCAAYSSAIAAADAAGNSGEPWIAGWDAGLVAERDAQEVIFKKYLEE